MHRTTIYLDEDLKLRLAAVALGRGMTEAALLREALQRHLDELPQPALEAVGRSEDGGVADRLDEELEVLGFGRR